ncbi:MAG: hypothetical protein E6R14_08005 [Thermomicrobiales bacterium]|nr:MAG: hypothetical protein E6R14_08005 [Thermomicrobiales bacterium]
MIFRFFTLLTIAAAGFALPMTCAQGASATDSVTIDIPAYQVLDSSTKTPATPAGADVDPSLVQQLLETLPLDCGDGATPRAAEQPATFDTQPFVPGYLVSPSLLTEESADFFAPPPVLIHFDSHAGPPEAPPPKSID